MPSNRRKPHGRAKRNPCLAAAIAIKSTEPAFPRLTVASRRPRHPFFGRRARVPSPAPSTAYHGRAKISLGGWAGLPERSLPRRRTLTLTITLTSKTAARHPIVGEQADSRMTTGRRISRLAKPQNQTQVLPSPETNPTFSLFFSLRLLKRRPRSHLYRRFRLTRRSYLFLLN